jgi:antitoxin component of RelBE/YafQ-DinJ toxin-antitoxin module
MAKKVVSVRLEEWLSEDVTRMAKAQGLAPSLLMRQFIFQGVTNQNVLAEYVTAEGEKTEKLLRRIESVVVGHLHLATAIAKNDKTEFMKTLLRGQQVVRLLDEKETSEE